MCARKTDKKKLFAFSTGEQKGILLLIPLLAVISIIFIRTNRPSADPALTAYSNEIIGNSSKASRETAGNIDRRGTEGSNRSSISTARKTPSEYELFDFDPNTIDLAGLKRLGFSERQAEVIINYRDAGAVFRTHEDFAKCYTVSEEKFEELCPYIRIANAAQTDNAATKSDGKPEQTMREYSHANESPDIPVTGNTGTSGIPAPTTPLTNPAPMALLDLNTADSAELTKVRGIGAITASRIVRYRELLGGYADLSQLKEIVGMTDRNYTMIIQQIFVDISKIQKIDINFAPPESMKGHPYISSRTLDKILKHRQLKGGWSTTEELIEQDILTEAQAARLAPYLYFQSNNAD